MDATAILEQEYGNDPVAQDLIDLWRTEGYTDEKILSVLHSFY